MNDSAPAPQLDVEALQRENAALRRALQLLEQQLAERDAMLKFKSDALLESGLDGQFHSLAERLYASEQAFRAVLEHSPDYIARYDLSFRRVYANPALRALTKLDVLGKTPIELGAFVN